MKVVKIVLIWGLLLFALVLGSGCMPGPEEYAGATATVMAAQSQATQTAVWLAPQQTAIPLVAQEFAEAEAVRQNAWTSFWVTLGRSAPFVAFAVLAVVFAFAYWAWYYKTRLQPARERARGVVTETENTLVLVAFPNGDRWIAHKGTVGHLDFQPAKGPIQPLQLPERVVMNADTALAFSRALQALGKQADRGAIAMAVAQAMHNMLPANRQLEVKE